MNYELYRICTVSYEIWLYSLLPQKYINIRQYMHNSYIFLHFLILFKCFMSKKVSAVCSVDLRQVITPCLRYIRLKHGIRLAKVIYVDFV